jgi:hypothetical protein
MATMAVYTSCLQERGTRLASIHTRIATSAALANREMKSCFLRSNIKMPFCRVPVTLELETHTLSLESACKREGGECE